MCYIIKPKYQTHFSKPTTLSYHLFHNKQPGSTPNKQTIRPKQARHNHLHAHTKASISNHCQPNLRIKPKPTTLPHHSPHNKQPNSTTTGHHHHHNHHLAHPPKASKPPKSVNFQPLLFPGSGRGLNTTSPATASGTPSGVIR